MKIMKHLKLFLIILFIIVSTQVEAQWTEETSFNQVISGLKSFNNKLFITGGFTKIGGADCYWYSTFNGTSFTTQSTLISGTGLRELEVCNGELYCTGAISYGYGTGVFKWSGSNWNAIGNFSTSHSGIYADGNDLYVGGDFGTISKKIGSGSFTSMPTLDNTNDNINAINKFNSDIIIAGMIHTYDSIALNNIARWDGSKWQPIGSGLNSSANCLAVYKSELYVGGGFSTAGGQSAKYIAKWNGTNWSDVGGSMTGNGYNGIRDMVVYDNKLYVVGDFDEMGGVSTKYVAIWDGTSWNSLSLDSSSNFANCVEVYNSKLYVGTFDFSNSHIYSHSLSPSGIQNNSERLQITFYPNPTLGNAHIDLGKTCKEVDLKVSNTLGQVVLSKSFKTTNKLDFEIKESTGVYFVEIRTEDGKSAVLKVIKE